jgi:cobalamin biosynthesis protein CobT
MELAAKSLVKDYTLRFVYKKIPKGMAAGYMFPPANLILLPQISVTDLSREKQREYTACLYHELRHHALSRKEDLDRTMAKNVMVKDIFNVIEDARIELSPHYILEGGKQDLTENNLELSNKIMLDKDNLIVNKWVWTLTGILVALGRYGNLPIAEGMEDYFNIAMNILSDGRFEKSIYMDKAGCEVAADLAFEIYKAWQLENEEDPENKEGDGDSSDEKKDSKDSDKSDSKKSKKNGKSKGGKGKPSKDDNEESADDSGEPSEKEESESDNKKGKRKVKKEKSEKEESGAGSNADPSEEPSDDTGEAKSADDEPSEEEQKTILQQYMGEKEGSELKLDQRGLDVAAMGEEGDPKDFENNWWAKDKSEDIDYDRYNQHVGDSKVYIPFTKFDREIKPLLRPKEYNQISDQIKNKVLYLQNQLAIILRASAQTHTERFLKKGRIDQNSLYKVASGSRNVKMKMTNGMDIKSAVSLLIDLSGSMSGRKSELAVQIASLFGEALNGIPEIPFEIRGYNSSPSYGGQFATGEESESQLVRDGYTRSETVNHFLFKSFAENWTSVKERLGGCSLGLNDVKPEEGCCGGCNIDHENIIVAAHHLFARQEKRKVLIMLCDGLPSGYNGTYGGILIDELKKAIDKIRKSGIKLFCFGIQSDYVRTYYEPDVDIVHNLNDLDEKALRKLAEYLLRR